MASDLKSRIGGIQSDLEKRRGELLSELEEVEKIMKALGGLGKTSRRTRTSGKVNRRQEFIDIVGKNPGITVAEAAKQMDMDGPNYLYRVAGQLAKSGSLRKDGSGFYPTGTEEQQEEPDNPASESADREPAVA